MSGTSNEKPQKDDVMKMAVDIVSAYVSNNPLPSAQITEVIRSVFGALDSLSGGAAEMREEAPKPAVPIKKSVTADYLICLEDGKKLKMLKRHLRTNYGMTPDEYKSKWGLPADYPIVAPNYASQRSAFAKKIGLGRKTKG
ncbi:MucR family transcriptional regulator [Oleispirillum naphthae]|uniref:MucR family transcriptional regulator n=1 Tax=Oleispirillum naphthae TaxID=2838853 RepID=UPI00308224E9